MSRGLVSALAASVLCAAGAHAAPVPIDAGEYRPRVLTGAAEIVRVEAFRLDPTPVTNADFAAFLAEHPEWQRDRAPAIYRDPGYLADFRQADPARAVTQVSWFAAAAYCESRGGRLPTLDEWEYVADAYREQSPDAYATMLFDYYADPSSHAQRRADAGLAGRWGVRNLHGVVLEWVEDFQLLLGDGSCGDTARFLVENDPAHYVTFLRYQTRSNYAPQTTTSTLGFRCAYDLED